MFSSQLQSMNKFTTKSVLLLTEELSNSYNYSAKTIIFKVKIGLDINQKKLDKRILLILQPNN